MSRETLITPVELLENLRNMCSYYFNVNLTLMIDVEGWSELGFESLRHLITGRAGEGGLHLKERQLVTSLYLHEAEVLKAREIVDYLVDVEGWIELERELPTEERNVRRSRVKAVGSHGGDRSEQVATSENSNLKAGSTSANYRLAKLKRDHPEIADQFAAGVFKNVTDAERAAGIKPPKRNLKRIVVDLDDPEDSLAEAVYQYLPGYSLIKPDQHKATLMALFDQMSDSAQDDFFEFLNRYMSP